MTRDYALGEAASTHSKCGWRPYRGLGEAVLGDVAEEATRHASINSCIIPAAMLIGTRLAGYLSTCLGMSAVFGALLLGLTCYTFSTS